MKERPILFSGPMVRALLNGNKTQTRRVVKPDGKYRLDIVCPADGGPPRCPYGQPGDRLWVRESWMDLRGVEGAIANCMYRATFGNAPDGGKWKSSIHMPRWASRITLEIVSVRVERLQDISEADAIAEGVKNSLHLSGGRFARENFEHLWWTINGDGSWEDNPWVWVVEFNRVTE